MRLVNAIAFGFLAAALSAGCGGTSSAEVSGTIKFDGKPVEQGSIEFHPVDGSGPTAGGSIENGKYTAKKVPVGTAKVRIHGVKFTGKKKMYDDPKAEFVQTSDELLPPKYSDVKSTELKYDVTAGSQTKDFDLPK